MQNIAQLLTMLLKYPPTDAHINITMKLMNKMYILWNSIVSVDFSIRLQKRSLCPKTELNPEMMRKQVKRTPKHVYPFTHIPILITPLQNWMIAENY